MKSKIGTATFIKQVGQGEGGAFRGDARLFKLSAVVPYWHVGPNVGNDAPAGHTRYVVVSVDGCILHGGAVLPATTVWAITEEGEKVVTIGDDTFHTDSSFCLMLGGWLSHKQALETLGFEADAGVEKIDPDDILKAALLEFTAGAEFQRDPPDGMAVLLSEINTSAFETPEDGDEDNTGTNN